MPRGASIRRTTNETDIRLDLAIDGTGASEITTGNGFMDHMLSLFAKHGLFDLRLTCTGDVNVDFHHSAEDIGICLGDAFRQALGDSKGIVRYGTSYVPMDESLARVCVDICARPTLIYEVVLIDRTVGEFECDLARDFFKSLADHGAMTLHIDLLRGRNSHHSLEAVFKACGRALSTACAINSRAPDDIPSTKGIL